MSSQTKFPTNPRDFNSMHLQKEGESKIVSLIIY
jgi:hypothetical protein